jgi:hypothetical protein
MSVEDQPQQPNKSMRVVGIGIGLLSVVFAVGLGVLIFYVVRPRGEKIGDTNLSDPLATQMVQAKAGDSLVFRVDASVRIGVLGVLNDDAIEREASSQLQKSLLTVRATAPSGREHSATCAVYKGRAATTTTTPGKLTRSGMLNDCSIPLDEAGAWRVRGSVAWHSELRLESATLETRLEAAKH